MGYHETRKLFEDFCAVKDYISYPSFRHLRSLVEIECGREYVSELSDLFREDTCPYCGAAGWYKRHSLGKLIHERCGHWYVSPFDYVEDLMKDAFPVAAQARKEGRHHSYSLGEIAEGLFCLLGYVPIAAFQSLLSFTQDLPAQPVRAARRPPTRLKTPAPPTRPKFRVHQGGK